MEKERDGLTARDWKAMYMLLFHGIREALELLPAQPENASCGERLGKALRDAEERYITAAD